MNGSIAVNDSSTPFGACAASLAWLTAVRLGHEWRRWTRLPPPAVTWQISSGLKLVSVADDLPSPRQRQNVGVQRAALAGVPYDPAPPVLGSS